MTEILIKKYENRRLYCVNEARYVSLTEIKEFLQRGENVKVVEKKSGDDITKYIMMQVLMEERYELIPTYFYQMMLQMPKENLSQFFGQFFPWMMQSWQNNLQGESANNPFAAVNPFMSNNPFMGNANPFAQGGNFFKNPFMPTMTGDSEQESKPASNPMEEVLRRLKELEERLDDE
jgi:polyhydroxyalkanoate synthesis repressor PhaR